MHALPLSAGVLSIRKVILAQISCSAKGSKTAFNKLIWARMFEVRLVAQALISPSSPGR
ncbi:hypothetical protein HMPREF0670_00623 [Prevotella sp. oral taxon 317 str. F0108]|nr:hypothetical protein HMPREF0670_00623 [Prevotella sp. oral taxon 317 str. F0108]